MIPAGTTSDPFPGTVYVEGIATGRQWVTWELSGSSGQVIASDTVVFTVIDFGLASVDLEATDAARKHDITRDTGGVYDDVEWVDPSPDGTLQGAPDDHRLPVCYTRSGPHGAVHVRVEQVDIRLLGNLGVTSVMVRANGTIGGQTITLPETAAAISGDQIVALNLDSPEAIPDVIRNTEIVLNWQVSLDGGPWLDVGTSLNTAYITWDDPLAAAPFETCLYVGCQAAEDMGTTHTEQQVVNRIFSDGFAGLNVRRVDGTILKYWDGGNARATDTAGLLADANGQCGAWAEFFVDTLRSQGIGGADKIGVYAASNPGNDGFLVKSWSFIGSGSSPGTSPYSWVVGTDVVDNAGVPGQGNPNRPGAFFNHFIVRFGGRYYDPSYGGPSYATQWEWEDASLDGFFTIIGGVALAKPNDLGPANVETLFVVI